MKTKDDLKEFGSYLAVVIYALLLIATCAAIWNGVATGKIAKTIGWAAGVHFVADGVVVVLAINYISSKFKELRAKRKEQDKEAKKGVNNTKISKPISKKK